MFALWMWEDNNIVQKHKFIKLSSKATHKNIQNNRQNQFDEKMTFKLLFLVNHSHAALTA